MFDDGIYKYFTAVSVLISIILYEYMLQAGSNKGKRKTIHVSSSVSCKVSLQLSILIVIERVILIILRKSLASARFISLTLNLVFPTNNHNDNQKEKNSDLKPKSWNRIQHSSNILKKA